MSTTQKLLIVGGVILLTLLVGGGMFGYWAFITVPNEVARLENRLDTQKDVMDDYFNKMWTILNQKAGVASEYKNSFKEIYVPLIEGRYSKGDGSLMKWVTEHNPTFDASLYKDLMASIEAERNGFFIEQKKMRDLLLFHKDLRMVAPKAWFVNAEPYDYTPITAEGAKEAIETRVEKDTDLFKK